MADIEFVTNLESKPSLSEYLYKNGMSACSVAAMILIMHAVAFKGNNSSKSLHRLYFLLYKNILYILIPEVVKAPSSERQDLHFVITPPLMVHLGPPGTQCSFPMTAPTNTWTR